VFDWIKACWLNRHDPDRPAAEWDGLHFVSQCKRCSRPVRRVKHGQWVALRPGKDFTPE